MQPQRPPIGITSILWNVIGSECFTLGFMACQREHSASSGIQPGDPAAVLFELKLGCYVIVLQVHRASMTFKAANPCGRLHSLTWRKRSWWPMLRQAAAVTVLAR